MINRLDLLAEMVTARITLAEGTLERILKEPKQMIYTDALRHKITENEITLGQIKELQQRMHPREDEKEVEEAKAAAMHAFFSYMGRQVPDSVHVEGGMATLAVPVARSYIETHPEDAALLIVALIDEYSANSVEPTLMEQDEESS